MDLMSLGIGVFLGVAIGAIADVLRFNRDRSFYPTLLIVIASYYVLFALMSGHSVIVEIAVAMAFSTVAIASALRWRLLIAWGLLLHGIFDFARGGIIGDAGAPHWWPEFCGGVDVALALWLFAATWWGSSISRRRAND